MLGILGELLLILSFLACAVSGVSYFLAVRRPLQEAEWRWLGRASWRVVTVSVTVASVILSYFIFTHQFQYAYVWQQSSRDLATHFLLSAFWAGQEGSFLLWIVLMAYMGVALMRYAGREYEPAVMAVLAFCQVFLISMVVGLKFGTVTVGASPFLTIYEKFPNTPEGFIPPDGSGLNDLLQNYWMAIHPPTLFVGFTAMIGPFAFAIAALWLRKYTTWVKPALPWTIFANMILMVGIAMGGYWAYETLSFGGYWAWDPVENSSLVPWLTGVAALHMMIVQKRSGASHKAALFLCILSFMLVVYSTFLTRSGILGDVSVHSFVDLGLYLQLVIWILSMAVVGFGLFLYRYSELPKPVKEPNVLSREFMIFSGALILCAVALVVILGTSAPILGRLFRDAPSAVAIEFYNAWTLPLAIGFMFLAGLGQLFWWNKMSVENVNQVLLRPVVLSVISTIAVLVFTPFVERTTAIADAGAVAASGLHEAGILSGLSGYWQVYGGGILLLLLVFVSFFALYGNGAVLWRIGRGNLRMAGGAIAHIGMTVMILGFIASSSFDNLLSEPGRENFILNRGETRTVDGYTMTYSGTEANSEGRPQYVMDIVDARGRAFTLKPVVYKSNKDQWIQHPDVKMFYERDLFLAVSPNLMFETPEQSQAAGGALTLQRGESRTLGNEDYQLTFRTFDTDIDSDLVPDSTAIAVAAVLDMTNLKTNETHELRPIYIVMEDGRQQYIQNRMNDWGVAVTFSGMNVDNGSANLVVEGVGVATEDWVVIQAHEKPFINLVWLGLFILTGGFAVAMVRRIQDQRTTLTPA
ncbi:MAG: cytochrome c biogenesis protein CcsA [Rhodothermales bacterium]|nr:cytochrome c biogenesis protein CcsA [Rhodothermales bacterium]